MPYTLAVRDSMMIAHSFNGEQFGPAQGMHGATYTVDVEFSAEQLVPKLNWVVDIGEASDTVAKVLAKYNFKNLDVLPELSGENTTTEFMCKKVFDGVAEEYRGRFKGQVKVTLSESHKAWASYSATLE